MSRLECDCCGEMVDVSNRTLALPFICDRCGEDAAYNDAASNYIVECRYRSAVSAWARSENDNTKGVFDDYSTALEAAERERDGSILEYRIVPYVEDCALPIQSDRPEDYADYNRVPCQAAIDRVLAEKYDIDLGHKDNSAEMDQRLLDSINKSRESWVAKGWVELARADKKSGNS